MGQIPVRSLASRQKHEDGNGGQLQSRGDERHPERRRLVVEDAEQRAAAEPRHPVDHVHRAEGRSPPLLRRHRRDRGAHHRFLSAHADPPQRHADGRQPEVSQKHQRRRGGGGDGRDDHGPQADPVERPSERQRGDGVGRHGDRVEERDPGRRHQPALVEVEGDQRIVGVSGGDERDRQHVDPEDRGQTLGLERLRSQVEVPRPREQIPRRQQHRYRKESGHDENAEGLAVAVVVGEDALRISGPVMAPA